MLPIAFGMPGGYELVILAGVVFLFFGNRLPSVMRSLGQSVTEFKKGVNGIEEDMNAATTADAKPAPTVASAPTVTATASAAPQD